MAAVYHRFDSPKVMPSYSQSWAAFASVTAYSNCLVQGLQYGTRMVDVSCRYFQRGFTDSVTEDDSVAVIGVCTHPRIKRDNPECERCIIPRLARHQLCPGISQKFDQVREQFRYRCTVHKVKVTDPFSQCRSLRNCPLDTEELAG